MRIFYGLVFFPLYIGWIIYYVFIRKDIRHHKNDLYALTFFEASWAAIYYWLFF